MACFDGAVAGALGVAHRVHARLALGAHVEVVLEELAEQRPAVDVEAGLELLVGEASGLVVSQEADEAFVAGVGDREGLARLGRLRRPTRASRPALPSASSLWRAAR